MNSVAKSAVIEWDHVPAFPRLWGLKRGPRADLPQREEKSAAPVLLSAGLGAALAIPSLSSPDLKLHVHTAMDAMGALLAIEVCGRRAAMRAPGPDPLLREAGLGAAVKLPDAIGLGAVLRKA
jgi:hypothetical protein